MTISLAIQGMSCQHCVNRVKKAIDSLPGIQKSDVQVGIATLDIDTSLTSPDTVKRVVEDAGYIVTGVNQ